MMLSDHREQVAYRASRAVEPHHDEGFAGGDVAQQSRQPGLAVVGARDVLLHDREGARATQLIALGVVPCSSIELAWPISRSAAAAFWLLRGMAVVSFLIPLILRTDKLSVNSRL